MREHISNVEAFFKERVGTNSNPQVYVAADFESSDAMHREVFGTPGSGFWGEADPRELLLSRTCDGRHLIEFGVFAHEYLHSLQIDTFQDRFYVDGHLDQKDYGPASIPQGQAESARSGYRDSIRRGDYAEVRRVRVWGAERTTETLREARLYLQSGMHNQLGLLAAKLVAQRAGPQSLL